MAILPLPAVATVDVGAKLGAVSLAVRRLPQLAPSADTAGGGATAAGGSALSVGAAKLGVTALCVAGAAGSYAVCSSGGALPGAAAKVSHHHVARPAPRQGGLAAAIHAPADKANVSTGGVCM